MLKRGLRAPRAQQGVILIEGLIAILIFAFGVLALIGLQATSIKENMNAKYRADASFLANRLVGQMMADKVNRSQYADGGSAPERATWISDIAALLPNGTGSVVFDATDITRVTVTVRWRKSQEDDAHSYSVVARVTDKE